MAVPYRRATELMLLNAACPNTPPHVLEQLSIEDDPRLLQHIAENPNSPLITVGYLAGHRYTDVRIAVTHNPNVPIDIISALTNDENVDVRFAIAANPLLPISVIDEACNDENPYVAARARRTFDRMLNEFTQDGTIESALESVRIKRLDQAS